MEWTNQSVNKGIKKWISGFPGGPAAKTHPPNAGGAGWIPDQGTRPHMFQLRVHMPQLKRFHVLQWRSKILSAITKTRHSQIILKKKKERNELIQEPEIQ